MFQGQLLMNVVVELNLRPVDKLHYLATKTVFYIIKFLIKLLLCPIYCIEPQEWDHNNNVMTPRNVFVSAFQYPKRCSIQ